MGNGTIPSRLFGYLIPEGLPVDHAQGSQRRPAVLEGVGNIRGEGEAH